jgi:molybdopterin converting factor small subunit
MTVRVVAFGRVRELLGVGERGLTVDSDACVADAWAALTAEVAALQDAAPTTRVARNGVIAAWDEPLHEGDELALLPPVGGG